MIFTVFYILCAMGCSFIFGIFYVHDEDDESQEEHEMVALIASALWPISVVILATLSLFSLGKTVRKFLRLS